MDLTSLDEKHVVRNSCLPFFDALCELVPECYVNIQEDLKSSKRFTVQQKTQRLQALQTNLHLAKEWPVRHPHSMWRVADESGYFHLEDVNTGMRVYFRAIDPLTKTAPKGGVTLAAKARFTQGVARGKGEVEENLLGYPDLSDINLMLVCDYSKIIEPVFMRMYKLMTPGSYHSQGDVAYSFPVYHSGFGGGDVIGFDGFVPDPGDSDDILTGLLDEESILG